MSKVAYLSRNDGTDTRISKQCLTLLEEGHEVSLIGWDWQQSNGATAALPSEVASAIFRSEAPRSKRDTIQFLNFAVRQLMHLKPDIVHAVNEDLLLLASFFKKVLGFELVGDLFDSQLLRVADNLTGSLRRQAALVALRTADRLIVTDEFRLAELPDQFKNKSIVVPNYPVDHDPDLYKTLEPGGFTKIFVAGSLSETRGLQEIVASVRQLSSVRIVAAGWLYDDAAVAFTRYPEVDYHGVLSPFDAMELAANCHLNFAHYAPINRNNCLASPNKVYDSLCLGRPILINSEVQLSQWVLDMDAGGSSEYGDVDGLSDLIERLREPIGWERRRNQMRKLFEGAFSWETAVKPMVEMYRELSIGKR